MTIHVALDQALRASAPDARFMTFRDGTPLGFAGEELRAPVDLAAVDPRITSLLLAVEDRRYSHHRGVDPRAIARSVLRDLRTRSLSEGGSTITQQLLKNTLFRGWPRWPRKVMELLTAPIVDGLLGKAVVLERYLASVYMGGGQYGFRSAALAILGKEPRSLSWAEAALLAGLPAAPEKYAPSGDREMAKSRRDYVLRAGHRSGLLSTKELACAVAAPLPAARIMPAALRDFLHAPVLRSGSCAETTLDRNIQLTAWRVAHRFKDNGFCAIACVEVATGAVRAAVTAWCDPRMGHDVAVRGALSPGSALKPFVLAAALGTGYRASNRFRSGSINIALPDTLWRVSNWRGVSYGTPTLEEATLVSDNTVYARLITEMGDAVSAELMGRVGLPAIPSPGPTITLGVLRRGVSLVDVAASYVGLVEGAGYRQPYYSADSPSEPIDVTDVVCESALAGTRSILNRLVREQVSAELADAGAFGKTGTPDDGRSGWFVGVSGDLAVAAVVGGVQEFSGLKARIAAEAWRSFLQQLTALRAQIGASNA